MLKSIITSREAQICRETKIVRDFKTVLNDIPKMDRNINNKIKQYQDRQALSKLGANQIRSR